MKLIETGKLRSRLASLRERHWTKAQRVTVVAAIAIVMGCLFVTSYSLALGDPVPHEINAALIGDRAAGVRSVDAVERVTGAKVVFRPYNSLARK